MVSLEELQRMSHAELTAELKKATLELLRLRFAVSSKQSKTTAGIKTLRKYIARINMVHSNARKAERSIEKVRENPHSQVIQ